MTRKGGLYINICKNTCIKIIIFRNFTRKILSLEILQKLEEKEKSTSKKGAFLYVFDQEKYMKLENEGLKFI